MSLHEQSPICDTRRVDCAGLPAISNCGQLTRRLRVSTVSLDGPPPAVTVVIPCYNYARYLPAAVDSVLSQDGACVDVIIVDDASRDDSALVAARLAAADPRVSLIEHTRNAGPVQTFNDGLERARGEFLVRLDADDLLTPGSLRRALAVMRKHSSVGLVYGRPLHFAGDVLPRHRDRPTSWTLWPGREWLAARCRSGFNVITSPEVVLRRSIVDLVGGQQPLAHTHDMEMWLRVSAFCDVAYIHGADQAWHREHALSLSAREVDSLRDLIERRDAFRTLFAGVAGSIPDADALKEAAESVLAAQAIELAKRHYDRPAPDPSAVAELRTIARNLSPGIEGSRAWTGLDRRMALGPGAARRHPAFVMERVLRGLRDRRSRRRWNRTGEW